MSKIIPLQPERVDIQHYRGDTLRIYSVFYEDSDGDGVPDEPLTPIDFTGGGNNIHSATMQVRLHPMAEELLIGATTETGEIVLNENGEVAVEVHDFMIGHNYTRVWYDLRVTDETGASQTLQYGRITLQLSVYANNG